MRIYIYFFLWEFHSLSIYLGSDNGEIICVCYLCSIDVPNIFVFPSHPMDWFFLAILISTSIPLLSQIYGSVCAVLADLSYRVSYVHVLVHLIYLWLFFQFVSPTPLFSPVLWLCQRSFDRVVELEQSSGVSWNMHDIGIYRAVALWTPWWFPRVQCGFCFEKSRLLLVFASTSLLLGKSCCGLGAIPFPAELLE